jgi:hypothetical protein
MFDINLHTLPGTSEGSGGCYIRLVNTIHTVVEGLNMIMDVAQTDLSYFLF